MVAQNLACDLSKEKALRVCHIAGFTPVPCGETHVRTLEDIAALAIKNYI